MKKIMLFVITLVLLTGCAGSIKPELNPQIEKTQAFFNKTPFTALVDFYVHGNHYIDEKGNPLPDKEQSARIGSKGMLTKDYAVKKGAKGHIFVFSLKTEREMDIFVSEGTGVSAAWNPSNIYVHFSRPITQEDVTPEGMARILSSMVEFKGLEAGSELDDILEELDSSKPK